jgi:HSP20 family molecular chaperone IbpA
MFPWNFFPFNKEMKNRLQNMKPEDINQYIQGIMGNMMPSQFDGIMNPGNVSQSKKQPSQSSNKLQSAVFETHDSIFVRLPIKDEKLLKKIEIFHTANQLMVKNIPDLEDKNTITLPAIVKKKGSTAKYKDGVLEIKMVKSADLQFSQIDLSE